MTEWDIQNAIFRDYHTAHFLICPNYSPAGWHECDVFSVTKAGYMNEYEIKLTKADFKKDAGKMEREKFTWSGPVTNRSTKHQRLAIGDPQGPARFFFVLPVGIVDDVDVPEFAGIIRASAHPKSGRIHLEKTREAKRLHEQKVSQLVADHVKGVFYWRLWSERIRNARKNSSKQTGQQNTIEQKHETE
jgi:hypothetical protein